MKKFSEILKERMTISFEVFPPKNDKPVEPLFETLDKLMGFKPDLISCTYGAGGTNKGRQSEILAHITGYGTTIAQANYTCIGTKKEDALNLVREYTGFGVNTFLGLRGDFPKGQTGTAGDFDHGNELIAFLRSNFPDIEIAGGCYPEKHINALSLDSDISFMRAKQDAGVNYFISQLCHDIDNYCRFADKFRKAGITVPVVFGFMPVLSKDATINMAVSNGCSIPAPLAEIIGKYGDNPDDFKKAGKEFTIKQMFRLISEGVEGLQIFTLNKYADVADILETSGIRHAE